MLTNIFIMIYYRECHFLRTARFFMIYVYMITGSLQCIDSVSVCSSPVRLRCLCSSLKVEESDGGARGGGGGGGSH